LAKKPPADPYTRLLETQVDGAVVLDPTTGRVLTANKAAAKIFGFGSPQEMVGVNPLDHVPEEDRERVAVLVAGSLEKNRPNPAHIRMRTNDRRLTWVSVTASLVEHEGRKVTLATIRELTSQEARDSELREAENRYQRLFDGMLDGAVVLDVSTFQLVLANRSAADLFGFDSPKDMIGENPLNYIPAEDRDEVVRMIALALEDKGRNPAEIRVMTRDKREVWVSATATKIDYEGRTATLSMLRDITSEKAKDTALQAAEESKMRLMDAAAEAITVVQDGKLVYVNPAVARGAGLSQEQLVGIPFLDLVHPDEKQAVWERYERILAGYWFPEPATVRGLDPKGQTLWSEIREIPFTWQGRPAVMSLIHDITDRVWAEEDRKEKEERLRAIMENAWDGVAIFDETFHIKFESPSLRRMTGHAPEDWVGKAPQAFLIHPDDLTTLLTRIEEIKSQPGCTIRDFRVRYQHADGSWRTIEATGTNLLHDPKVNGIVVNFRDITDRVQAEEALKAREALLRSVVENAWDGVIIFDEGYGAIYESPTLTRITGYAPDEWKEASPAQWPIHPDDLPSILAHLETLRSQPGLTISSLRVRFRHKNGSWLTLEVTGQNLLQDPRVRGIVANFRDITRNVKAEEELKASEERFRTLIEKAADVVIVLDATAKIVYQSPSLERVTGYGHNEWLNMSLSELLIHPDDMEYLASVLERLLAQPGTTIEGVTARYRHKNGSWRFLEATVTNMLHDPKVNGLVANFRDITERRAAEEALKRSEALLSDTQQLARVGGWVYEVERKEALWTDETYRIHEIPKIPTIDHVGESLKCYPPEHRQTVAQAFEKCLNEGTPYDLELPFVTFRGNRRWVRTTGKAVRDGDKIVRILGNIIDITDRRTAEEALKESEAVYKRLFENTQTAMELVSGETGLVVLANESTARMFGFASADELIGVDSTQYLVPEDRDRVAAQMALALVDKSWSQGTELSVRTKDGRLLWINGLVTHTEYKGKPALLISLMDLTSRKQAEETLRQSEEKYRLVAESTNDEIWTSDINLNTTYVSPSVERLLGFTPEERMKQDIMSQMTPESFAKASEALAYHLALEEDPKADPNRVMRIELEYYRKDRSTVWLENQVSGIRDAHGKLIGFHGVARDVTERRKTEQALRASEEKYRFLAEKTNDLIWTADANLRPTYMSPSVERIIGLTPEEGLRRNLADIMTPESMVRAQEALLHHLAADRDPSADPNRTVRLELEFYRKDGSTIWLEEQVSGIRDANGTLVGFHGVARDISERRKTQEALRESEQRYRLLAENASDIIWVTDANIKITYASPSATSLLGCSMEELFNRSFDELLTPDSLARMTQVYQADLARETQTPGSMGERSIEIEVLCKDGSKVWLEAAVSAIRDSEGRFAGFQGACRNITERKRVQEALETSEIKYRALFENTLMGTEVIDVETGKVVLANGSIAAMFGFKSPADLVGTTPTDYVLPEDLDWMTRQIARTLAQPQGSEMVTMRARTQDGRVIWVTGSGVPFEYQGRRSVLLSLVDVTATREAEVKLQESEEKNRLLIDNAAEGVAVIQDGLIKFANPKCAEVSGRPVEELVSMPFLELVHPDDRQMMTENYARRLAGEDVPNAYQFRIFDKQGNTKSLLINAVRFDWEGRDATLAMLSDMTERMKAQEALAASETSYRNLFEQTMMGMELLDGQTGRVVLANHALARMFGFKSPEEMVGIDGITGWVMPEDMDWVLREFARAMADPEKRDVATLRVKGNDGRVVWVSGSGTFLDYQGKPAMLISLVDVTATKEAELKLHESEEKNRLLIDNAAEGIAVIQDGIAKFFNRRLVELTGWPAEELLSRSFLDLVHPDDREMIALNYMKRIASEDVPNNYQFRIIDKAGNTKWLQLSAVLFSWEGKPATLDMLSEVTERMKAEQALRDSEERFRALIEEATDAVAVVDATGKIIYYSPSIERVTGYTLEDWAGKSLQAWNILPEDIASMADILAGLVKEPGKSIEGITARFMSKDGSWHTLEATVRNMLHDPKIGGIVANFRDITERVKSEHALKESEERYRLVADNVSDVIWVTDMSLNPTYMSPSVTRMLGYTVAEALAGRVETRMTPASSKLAQRAFADAMAREAQQPGSELPEPQMDFEFVRKDGSTVWTSVKLTFIRGADGQPVAILGVLRDIAERKKAEDSLRKSEERFRGLVETTSDWVWEIDRDSRYTYVSPKVRDILGYEPRELLGHTPFEFMHQREGRRVAKIIRRFAAARLPFSLLENTCTHRDGHSVVLETSAVPMLGSDGAFLGYRGIDRDITERKKVEQELQRSLKRLEKTMESTIEAITTTIETRDPYTTGHQMRVTDLACTIAKLMEIPPTQIEGIRVAGLVHDIGKIAIPTEILSKPGKLNEVEFAMIQTHSKVGYNILKKIEFPWPVARTVLQHHERWNGTGYPHGVRGEEILLEARILAVADVMEAMASHRPYRPSIGLDKALDEVGRNSGVLYDPAVVKACLTAFNLGGFKFSTTIPGVTGAGGEASTDRPIYSLEDH
jgi:PAS domain S-box-containing protein/putative nucleotidyltransferase with HDIG domain